MPVEGTASAATPLMCGSRFANLVCVNQTQSRDSVVFTAFFQRGEFLHS